VVISGGGGGVRKGVVVKAARTRYAGWCIGEVTRGSGRVGK